MDVLFLGHITDPILPIPPVRGGAPQTLLHDLATGLQDLQIGVVSPWQDSLGKPPEVERADLAYFHLPVEDRRVRMRERIPDALRRFVPDLREMSYLKRAAKVIQQQRPKLVVVNNRLHYASFLRGVGVRQPIIVWQHNCLPLGYLRRHKESVTAVVAVSKHLLCAARFYLVGEPLEGTFVHNGVDTVFWSPQAPDSSSRHLAPRLLCVGRLTPHKGQHVVIQAMPIILRSHKDAKLVIVGASGHHHQEGSTGTSSYEKQLRFLAARACPSNATFMGNLRPDAVLSESRKASLGLMPSVGTEIEGHPMTVLEGMACGLPMVCNRVPGVSETISHRANGILVDVPFDPEEWAARILELLNDGDLRARLGHNARQTVLERFTTDRMVKDFRSYIEKFL